MEHSNDIGCVLGPDLAAKTSEHLSRGFQKLPGVFPSVFLYDELHRSWFPNPTPQQRSTKKDKHDRSLKLEM